MEAALLCSSLPGGHSSRQHRQDDVMPYPPTAPPRRLLALPSPEPPRHRHASPPPEPPPGHISRSNGKESLRMAHPTPATGTSKAHCLCRRLETSPFCHHGICSKNKILCIFVEIHIGVTNGEKHL